MKSLILVIFIVLSFRMQCIAAMSQYIQYESQEFVGTVETPRIEDGVKLVLTNIFSAYEAYYFLYSEVYNEKKPEILKTALSNLGIFFNELLLYCNKQGYFGLQSAIFALKKQEIEDSIDFFEARFNTQESMVTQIKLRSQKLYETFHALFIIAEMFNYSQMQANVEVLWDSTIFLHEPSHEARLNEVVSNYLSKRAQLNAQRARSNTWPLLSLSWLNNLR